MKIRIKSLLLGLALAGVCSRGETEWLHFRGMCDASAMEMLTDDLFVVGNDEDNVLRVYSRARTGFPVQELDFSRFYQLKRRTLEIDLEAAARLGDRIYWISSHGANAKGKVQASRHRFFATQVFTSNGLPKLRPVGILFSGLVRELAAHPALAPLNLIAASRKPPKSPGGLNIEGLAPTPDGRLLIGFRNPIPRGKALIVPMLNPEGVTSGEKPRFGEPKYLDLGGRGVRSIAPYARGYLIVAGSYGAESGASQLHFWDGTSETTERISATIAGNPEGIAVIPGASDDLLFLISDDGAVKIGGADCKKLKDDSLKSFRAYQFPIPRSTAHTAGGRLFFGREQATAR